MLLWIAGIVARNGLHIGATCVAGASHVAARGCATRYCVLAAAFDRGGCATETNCFACSKPSPIGVGMAKRNGTRTRVPEIGASQTSASRSAMRYLIAGRSGT